MQKDKLFAGGVRAELPDKHVTTPTIPVIPDDIEPGAPSQGALSPISPLSLSPTAETFLHITEEQFTWLTYRLGVDTDEAACDLMQPEIPLLTARSWLADPYFESLYLRCLENKRDAFRTLGTQLLPKALRVINKLMDSDSAKANQAGLTLLLKTQALLDQPQKDTSDAVQKLLDALRTPGTITPAIVTPRE